MWLHQNCAELATFAKVRITWRPSWHEEIVRGDEGHLGMHVNQAKPLDTEAPTNAPTTSKSRTPSAQTQQQASTHPHGTFTDPLSSTNQRIPFSSTIKKIHPPLQIKESHPPLQIKEPHPPLRSKESHPPLQTKDQRIPTGFLSNS